jgi:1-deoxy-D-xylulose-5-phosphate synthase
MWDLSMLNLVPGLRFAAPRDAGQFRAQLGEATDVPDAPTVVRYPKGDVGPDIPAVDRIGGVDVLRRAGESDVLLVSVGATATLCLEVADRLADQGIGVSVVDPRWVKPVDPALVALAGAHRLLVTVEDGLRAGGIGTAIAQACGDAGVDTPVRNYGIPSEFLGHGTRAEVLAAVGLSAQDISRGVVETIARLGAADVVAHTVPESADHAED